MAEATTTEKANHRIRPLLTTEYSTDEGADLDGAARRNTFIRYQSIEVGPSQTDQARCRPARMGQVLGDAEISQKIQRRVFDDDTDKHGQLLKTKAQRSFCECELFCSDSIAGWAAELTDSERSGSPSYQGLPRHPQTPRSRSYLEIKKLQRLPYQFLVYSGTGAFLWWPLYKGYLPFLLFVSVVFGLIDPGTSHLRVGLLMVGPALLLAWWTTPRGDNDGLWILIFPMLGVAIFVAAGCHWAGARFSQRSKSYR
jgi:hypothetical protein